MIDSFSLGDTVRMKKPHACGSDTWTITRVGADVKIKCLGCGRVVMLDRLAFMKAAKTITEKGSNE
ncbi:MAG: DUF951 domain-containing protein [Clostridia bacterium]|nr:DUF951 domain-containing protein [Clostridia bacterium]